jgi:oligopeptide/dipeptide ABC transporter ATP-binding protein
LSEPVLQVRGLRVAFRTPRGTLTAVDGVDLDVRAGETLCVVGESGCGKSVTALSILRLLPEPPARVEAGEVLYRGDDLLRLDDEALRRVRGSRIAMIFQEPMTSLNPVFRVEDLIGEALRVHTSMSAAERRDRVIELLELVGIPDPAHRTRDYPHQLSGGMRQRVMIAMALACEPDVLIADEPTTALDVTIQAQILELIESLKERFSMAVLLITHDLGVVAQTAQRVAVFYAGRVVESGDVDEIFSAPRHPYTRGLMLAMPGHAGHRERLNVIEGVVPDLSARPAGCSFRERCSVAQDDCAAIDPKLEMHGGRAVACLHPLEPEAP